MDYAIYGINRVAKDFVYMFPDFNIKCFIDEETSFNNWEGKRVYKLNEIESIKEEFDEIIICDFETEKEKRLSQLEQCGYVYGKNCFFERDYFARLNSDSKKINPKNKPIAIWGTGKNSDYFSNRYFKYLPEFYIDTYRGNTEYNGKKVYYPNDLNCIQNYFVIIAVYKDEEIKNYLDNLGLHEGIDFINSKEIENTPSEMLTATIFDRNVYELNCHTPLNHMEFLTEGELYCCCSTFMTSMGNVKEGGVQAVWDSVKHKILCLSAVNRTYTFCNSKMCPLLFGKKKKDMDYRLADKYAIMKASPEVSAIGFDYTCNLKCETCRSELRIAKDCDKEKMLSFADYTINEILPNSKFFIMAGDGEVFVSEAYRKIYESQNMNNIQYIRLLSNGTLFNETNWKRFIQGKTGKVMLTASVDAATKTTYESIRRNGNFDKLKANMAFAGELRRKGELSYFRMNFVVQKRNYTEMIDFVKWGLEIGADEVFFTKILNWGTFTEKEFKGISMMEEDGVTPKPELKAILEHPIMKNRIVDLGTIQYEHSTINDINIENYYMWELERKVSGLFEL